MSLQRIIRVEDGAVGRQVQNKVATTAAQKVEARIAESKLRAVVQRSPSRQAAAQARVQAVQAAPEQKGRLAGSAARGVTSTAIREAGRATQAELERRKREQAKIQP